MSSSLADAIAIAAARLVVEEGQDYAGACRKAARDLDRQQGRRGELPTHEQIEDRVREHIELFCADTQPAELQALRGLAITWMQRLKAHRPHLAGAVWRGTATRHSDVRIDLYTDDPKSVEIELINHGIDYDAQSQRDGRGRQTEVLSIPARLPELGEWVSVHLTVHDHDELRGALKPDARGRSWRGDLAALERLMAGG